MQSLLFHEQKQLEELISVIVRRELQKALAEHGAIAKAVRKIVKHELEEWERKKRNQMSR